jgi:hypothetical protein
VKRRHPQTIYRDIKCFEERVLIERLPIKSRAIRFL